MFFAKKNTAAKDEQLASFSNVLELPACQKKKEVELPGTAIRRPGRPVRGAAHPQRPGLVVWVATH
jgi:hypothetical protein